MKFRLKKGGISVLRRKYTAHINAQIPTGLRTQISPRLLFQTQGRNSAFEVTLGYLGNYENDAILCPKF